ncbi:HD domain-containing protein [Anaerospora sp.]|uniref:HD domain-containing protein n=1 Tax=Anaerospora sp. TaxID=1960278 RepID=UPI00289765F4|nr:HD domain-containing protein [Anaerospora sp.]
MNRLFEIQVKLLNKINTCEDNSSRDHSLDWERIHLVSCAKVGELLALKRGENAELAAIACSIHDYGRILSGKQNNHAEEGYGPAKEFLAETGYFNEEETEMLSQAVRNHSSKEKVGTWLEEIVKDADVLDCYQYGMPLEREEQRKRLSFIVKELVG